MLEVGRAVDVEVGLDGGIRQPAALLCLFPDGQVLRVRGRGCVGHGQHHAGHATDVVPFRLARQEEVLDLEQPRALLDECALDALGLAAKDVVAVGLGAQDERRARRVGRGRCDELDAGRHAAGLEDAVAGPLSLLQHRVVGSIAFEQHKPRLWFFVLSFAKDKVVDSLARKVWFLALLRAGGGAVFRVRRIARVVLVGKLLERFKEGRDRGSIGRGREGAMGRDGRDRRDGRDAPRGEQSGRQFGERSNE